MDNFISNLQKHCPLSENSRKKLLQDMEEVPFSKGEHIIQEGMRNNDVYFIKQGFLRSYVRREDKEITLWFAGEGELAMLTPGTTPNPVSTINIEMLESGILLRTSRQKMESLFNQSIELANWGRKLAEYFLMQYEHYFTNYYWTNAQIQYESLLKEYPELLQKASLKQIASYLGITPQSLSRIRKKIAKS